MDVAVATLRPPGPSDTRAGAAAEVSFRPHSSVVRTAAYLVRGRAKQNIAPAMAATAGTPSPTERPMMSGLWSLLASIRAPATVTPPVEVALGGGGEYETGLPEVETRSCLLEPKEILLN